MKNKIISGKHLRIGRWLGTDPLIPLDQTAETLFRVGRQLPSALRCTCMGGLCTTSCGQQLAREPEERDNQK